MKRLLASPVFLMLFAVPIWGQSFTQLPGSGAWIPSIASSTPAYSTTLVIDAAGEKVAMCGRVFFFARTGTKDITKVHFRFGAVTKAGGSTLTISMQDLDLANGPPSQPDGTQDQTITVANADASFVSNTWYSSAAFSANRTVANGAAICMVWEYASFAGADSVVINGFTGDGNSTHMPSTSLYTASWAVNTSAPNLILEYTDGSFGTLGPTRFAVPAASAINTHSIALDTGTADEYALAFQVPVNMKVDAVWITALFGSSTANCEIILYEGTTPMTNGTITVDANAIAATSSGRVHVANFAEELTLTANTTYYLAVRPTVNGQSVSIYSVDVSTANMFQAFAGGPNWNYTTRLNQGSWAAQTTTRRMLYGLRISSIVSSAGGGSGRVIP